MNESIASHDYGYFAVVEMFYKKKERDLPFLFVFLQQKMAPVREGCHFRYTFLK